MIRKTKSGYKLVSKSKDSKGKHKNLGEFKTLSEARKREIEVEYFKRTKGEK